MSAPQVARLQALLSRVQTNRGKPRSLTNGAAAQSAAVPAPAIAAAPAIAKPSAFEEALPLATPGQDSIDTTPPPAVSFAKPQPHQQRPSAEPLPRAEPMRAEPMRAEPMRAEPMRAEPARAVRPAIETEHVRVPDIKRPPAQLPPQPDRPLPAPARPMAPGATPLEMALEGEVARAADAAAASLPAAPPPRLEARPDPSRELEGGAGRILADPTPPQPTRAIVQATTKHPPAQPNSFAELLKRSLALRPR
jgi:hypothetical protein